MIDAGSEVDEVLARCSMRIDGIVVGVAVGEEATVAVRGSWHDGLPATTGSAFYAASLTKQLTGLLTALSVERGEIARDDSVRSWLPSLPSWAADVTIDHLLHHTAGLPRELASDTVPRSSESVLEAVARLDAPASPPGTRFEYSNDGYVLLALALEQAAGMPIEQLAEQRIFTPLGMYSSSLRRTPQIRIVNEPPPPATIGDGGWWTTVDDVLAFLAALNSGRFRSASTRLMERGKLASGASIDYAWGVRAITVAGVLAASHGGSWQRWQSKTLRLPSENIAVAIAARTSDAQTISDLGDRLAAAARIG